MIQRTKPRKPRKNFPLTAHGNGQWCKKINKKLHYFGPWEDWQGSLTAYLDQKDDLQAGRTPRARNPEAATIADLLNGFLHSKQLLVSTGELAARSFGDYQRGA
jgi:hypothetical protein